MKKFITVFILVVTLLPNFVYADSATLRVNQPVGGTNTNTGGGGGGSSDTTAPQIFDVSVQTTYSSAIVNWSTNEISLGKLVWGVNQDYSDGQITTERYLTQQSAEIPNLQTLTKYYFKITAIDQSGNTRVYAGELLTLSEPDQTGPQNVSGFAVSPIIDRMNLSWINPNDVDFDAVRIVRSESFFPLDPFNGLVVYEGQGQVAVDNAVSPGVTYYYTIFAKDRTGNYSTGVVKIGLIVWYSEQDQGYPDAPIVDVNFQMAPGKLTNPASFDDFIFNYNHGSATSRDGLLPSNTDINVIVPQSALPNGTNSLILTIKDNSNSSGESSFLFAFNKTTKEFFTTIPALLADKSYELVITIFNSTKQILQKITKAFVVSTARAANEAYAEKTSRTPILWFIGLLILLTPAFIILRWIALGFHPPEEVITKPMAKPLVKKLASRKRKATLK